MAAASSSSRVPEEPTGIPSSAEPKLARGRAPVTGRRQMPGTQTTPTSQPTSPKQQKVAGSVKATADALSKTVPLSRKPIARPVTSTPTSDAAKTSRAAEYVRRVGVRMDMPPGATKAPAGAGPAKSARIVKPEETAPAAGPRPPSSPKPTIAALSPSSPATGEPKHAQAVPKISNLTAPIFKKVPLKASDDGIKALAKQFVISGEGADRRIVPAKGLGDKIERFFTSKQEAALAKFANENYLSLPEMRQLPGKIDAATKELQKPDGAKNVFTWVNSLTSHEKVALLKGLPNEVILPLYREAYTRGEEGADMTSTLQQRIDMPSFAGSISKESIVAQLFQPQKGAAFLVLLDLANKLSNKELVAHAKKNEVAFMALSPAQQKKIADALFDKMEPKEFRSLPTIVRQAFSGATVAEIALPGKVKALQDLLKSPLGAKDAFVRINLLPAAEKEALLKALPPESIVSLYVQAASRGGEDMATSLGSLAEEFATKEVIGKQLFLSQKEDDTVIDVWLGLAAKLSPQDLIEMAQKNKNAFAALTNKNQQRAIARALRHKLGDAEFNSNRLPDVIKKAVNREGAAARKVPPPPPRTDKGVLVGASPLKRESNESIGAQIFQPQQSKAHLAQLLELASKFKGQEILDLAHKHQNDFAKLGKEQQKLIAGALLAKFGTNKFYSYQIPEVIREAALDIK